MIEFKHVTKKFKNEVTALKDINITIEDGEFVAIIGLSGAGKSTFLRAINRLTTPTAGEILIDGDSLTAASKSQLRKIRRHIGLISQQFNLVKRSTVQKNVLSGRLGYYPTWKSILGIFSEEDYELVDNALERVGLEDKLHTRSDELSGGQQQRVSIARTIVQNANIILADEPVSALDPITSHVILKDLERINQELNTTVLINLHDVDLARDYSTRIIGMRAGEIVFDGTPAEATDAKLTEIYGEKILAVKGEEA
jgi:phosphonate transport system ATP-binding protein